METGDKIIWDSSFGYEIGYYEHESITQHDHVQVSLVTGVVIGSTGKPTNEVKPYSNELDEKLATKYGYKHSFDKKYKKYR